MSSPAAPPPPSLLARWAAALTVRRIATVLLLSGLGAALLNPIFVTPFPVVLGRTLFVDAPGLLAAIPAHGANQGQLAARSLSA